ncbi:LOW QUALITY PROTEIN: dapper homolog 2-like [Xyrauchen texanus]|uniref:LOW QUALITY PROTEIN: dapper homolog 2-like n=1 Tax=Xyrauchen texanus TaxID=154827 RepID=UPI002241DD6F|nr:LOW QUALITY PROTEIN: dapper homolog 2-like [Xyrauchen texanus]
MLGKKVPGSGVLSAAAGLDRARIGQRLQAALAGLQELHFLRDKQNTMVHWALTLNREETDTSNHENMSTEERRLEATLTLLKQQLTRLRRQDVGLKTHLQQLDQQISELKLDVCKASTEHLESDSRPSSGFYDLSDCGSGSLSNSCTSVYSESVSSSSQTSLLPHLSSSYATHGHRGSRQAIVSRCCSADESTAQSDTLRSIGVRLGSSCIRTTPVTAERARQRPVSMGDLDRVIPSDVKTSALSGSHSNPLVDPKYQSNLVSSNGTEVYCYPSPLHAVALQSPIFSLTRDQGRQVVAEGWNGQLGGGLEQINQNPNQGSTDSRSAVYINKLLQRSSIKLNLLNEIRRNDPQDQRPRSLEVTYGQLNGPQFLGSLQQIKNNKMPSENELVKRKTTSALNISQQLMNISSAETSSYGVKVPTHPAPCMALQQNCLPVRNKESDNGLSEKGTGLSIKESSLISKPVERKSSFTHSIKEGKASFGDKGGPPQCEFVHAEFVPAGSQRVKVRHADKKMKSVKLRKKSSEKPSAKKLNQKHLSLERGLCTKNRVDLKRSSSCRGKVTSLDESQIHSCLDCSNNLHCFPNKPHLQQSQSAKSIKSCKGHYPEPVHPMDQVRKKQSSRKWLSASEIQLPPTLHTQRSKVMPPSRKAAMVRSISARPRSGQWGCSPRPLPHSLSTSSYFSYLESRYPAAPISSRHAPQCESEYSAECASLFHSTIAASSDGEMSDYTTNCFGDSESSQGSQTASDSDGSLSMDEEVLLEEEEDNEGDLVWAQAAMGPTAAGLSPQQHHRPEPAACRIKASRALKKKIRRFQPASLKIMTLV